MVRGLHHMAFRCRDSEETRAFYEEVMGFPLVGALALEATATGRPVTVMHSFFEMAPDSFVAFFEVGDDPFEPKPQHDFDLHMALEADEATVASTVEAARARGLEVRGPSDHGFIRSTYFRDPNGYVVELTTPVPGKPKLGRETAGAAREALAAWTAAKAG
ncbi:MAG TPA: VOC family protein [Caulobacter sp.]|nr:VOC family protein [Caulobacter sp.]